MPKIEVASHAGACFGVGRALERVEKMLDGPAAVHTLGPLIHNPATVESLERRGATVVDESSIEDLHPGDVLVLRTHGVVPQVVNRAKAAHLQVLDATCPYVKKVHHAAQRLAASGRQVVVVGEAGHPEVDGILGHAPGACVVGSAEDAAAVPLERPIGLVVQTTQNRQLLEAVVAALKERGANVEVCDTICEATSERQQAARELAARANTMVVIGGRNSANTTRLAEICAAHTALHKNAVVHIVHHRQRMLPGDHGGRHHRRHTTVLIRPAGCQQLNGHTCRTGIGKIRRSNLRDPLRIDFLRIHVLSDRKSVV